MVCGEMVSGDMVCGEMVSGAIRLTRVRLARSLPPSARPVGALDLTEYSKSILESLFDRSLQPAHVA